MHHPADTHKDMGSVAGGAKDFCCSCEENGKRTELIETEHERGAEKDDGEFEDFDDDGNTMGEEKLDLHLVFKFPSFPEFTRIRRGKSQSVSEKHLSEEELKPRLEFANYGFLSDGDFGGTLYSNVNEKMEESGFGQNFLEETTLHNSDFLSEHNFTENSDAKFGPLHDNDNADKLKPNTEEPSSLESGEGSRLECLWEHQELIEQLKIELKKVRTMGGLPTILEESESPKIDKDVKQWENIDKVEDCMGKLRKLYRIYTETMRQFDILNYQKMYAIGFLQVKDHFQSTPKEKPSSLALKSFVWLSKHRSHGSNPVKKFINELQGDLELVYVGQTCVSWQFLQWQYKKALDLWNLDPHGVCLYNEVAGEFQQFQELILRFMEDEPFQGTRVESYVKSRCVLRNLLQVPIILEDNLNETREDNEKSSNEHDITARALVTIIEESIHVFCKFLHSEKDYTKRMADLHNPEDLKLLADVRKTLLKKERRLKDALRSANCILGKFRQNNGSEWDQVVHFLWQVDMKLVWRVLKMSKINREQLIWCRNKLSKISFVGRNVFLEPSFLLFPC